MSDARWRRVQDLYHGALERPAPVRAEFLSEECAGDAGLLHEVQSLLDQPISTEQFLLRQASRGQMTHLHVRVGQRFGVYQVQALSAVVGWARSIARAIRSSGATSPSRSCRVHSPSDPDRLARFEREARMLAALNHPNIGAIYGLEEADGIRALVLELVEGETLADRIARGPMSTEGGAADRAADSGGARGGARQGDRPSGSEARQRRADP